MSTGNVRPFSWWVLLRFSLLAMILTIAMTRLAWSHTFSQKSHLIAAQVEVDRLAPDVSAGEADFVVDDCNQITVEIVATKAVATSVEAPSGQILTEDNIEALGGQFVSFETPQGAGGLLIMPFNTPGFHYVFVFPSLGPGTYSVRFEAAEPLTEELAVITQVLTDSTVKTSLIATEPNLELGDLAVLSAFVFEDAVPVSTATVSVVIRSEYGTVINLSLLDDAGSADDIAGDGIYSGEFLPSSTGRYSALATIEGVTTNSVSFSRVNTTDFYVFSPKARLIGVVDDRGVDDDEDEIFDRVTIETEVEIVEAGSFQVFVHLATAMTKKLVRNSGELNLPQGTHSVDIDFGAGALLDAGEDGPYEISLVEIDVLEEQAAITVDRLQEAGRTRAYLLTHFRPLQPGSISGRVTAEDTGAALSGVEVLVYDINGILTAEANTDASGHYRIALGLHPGNYLVTTRNTQSFIDEIYRDIPCVGLCGSPDRAGTIIRVEASFDTPSIDFALAK